MVGWIPTPVRNVKRHQLVVSEGDSVSRIAHNLTGDGSRWTELVGANLHKPLSAGNVSGSPYRVFRTLDVKEKLFLPASWPGALGKGNVVEIDLDGAGAGAWSAGSSGQYDPLGTAITTVLTTLQGAGTPPAPYAMPDIAKVITSWWPYLPTGLPTTPALPGTPADLALWQRLIQSAVAFLQASKIQPGQIDILASIPWDKVPWDKIPWQQLMQVMLDATTRSQFWKLLVDSTTAYTSVQKQLGTVNGPVPKQIDFYDSNLWTSDPAMEGVNAFGWTNVPWKSITDGSWGKIDDPELLGCIAMNPARSAELAKHSECFKGDVVKLKKYMCNPQLDVSKCAEKADPSVPVVPGGVNWSCPNPPQCIADQFKTLGIPDPCSPMPTCIPQWYKDTTGGQALPVKEEEKKESSNAPIYIALGAAAIGLTAGIILSITATKA